MMKPQPSFAAGLVLLVVLGAQTMVVELAIPRLIAPVFGNTLFSWTAIIAVVLGALAAGYQIGGRLARGARLWPRIVSLSFASAMWVVVLALVGQTVVGTLSGFGIMAGPVVASALLAAVPAGLGAAVVPLVAQLSGRQAGGAAGASFAWSTVGSIAGVLATGYVLLPQLGISGAMLLGAGLVFAALLLAVGRILPAAAGLLAVGLAVWLVQERTSAALVDISNGYHRIRVVEGAGVRALYLDSTLEGSVRLGSAVPVLSYQRGFMGIMEGAPRLRRALFLGGGSFSMPRYLKQLRPEALVEAVEIDADVIDIARRYLELDDTVRVHHGDGRRVLANSTGRYDLIVNDAFNGVRKIPFHLVTTEFNQLVARRLSDTGLYAVNVIGHDRDSALVTSVTRTLQAVFPVVRSYRPRRRGANLWLLAARQPFVAGQPVPAVSRGQVLRDGHAPVEYLIARDVVPRFFR